MNIFHPQRQTHRASSTRLLIYFILLASLGIMRLQNHNVTVDKPPPSSHIAHIRVANSTSVVANKTAMKFSIPPIDSLIHPKNGKIIGDISWLLDFAIIGFPKSGTTFMKDYLNQSNETCVYEREFCMKQPSDVPNLVRHYHDAHLKLQQSLKDNYKKINFGLKCPGVLYRKHDLNIYRKYFPRTRLIIGLRHPVSWFESFYNYQSYRNVSLPPTNQLIGRCGPDTDPKVCTDRARFHAALARLGKTSMDTEDEISLLFGLRYEKFETKIIENSKQGGNDDIDHRRLAEKSTQKDGIPNDIFLYEVRQVTTEASKQIPMDLRKYLRVNTDFPDIFPFKQNKTRTINICEHDHDAVRALLVEHGTDAADWIRDYFVNSPSVNLASPESFYGFLDDWKLDPCLVK
mmetsp:Transcript_31441/g.62285  ORF Transcript_31441/g.62285 Transcript_31441/m.62285 type:complete len:403 (-) Transcript_31441:4-1212(-)